MDDPEKVFQAMLKMGMNEDEARYMLNALRIGPKQDKDFIMLYKYVNLDGLMNILNNGLLKIGVMKDFNDPFEMLPANSTCVSHLNSSYHYNQQTTGVLCLSETPSSSAMWGHYADSHHGACLAFKIPKNKFCLIFNHENPLAYLLEDDYPSNIIAQVKYGNTRYENNWKTPAPNEMTRELANYEFANFISLLRSKSSEWKNEREWRFIAQHHNNHICSYQNNVSLTGVFTSYLVQIFLGMRCQKSVFEIYSFISDKSNNYRENNQEYPLGNVKIYPAILDPNKSYEVICCDYALGEDPYLMPHEVLLNFLARYPEEE